MVLEGTRATGVEYLQSGTLHRVHAKRETVLSGGAYNSPQILLLSGIGPPEHLRSVGIEVLHELPGVGENLLEHPNLLNIYQIRSDTGFTRHLRFDRATLAVMKWLLRGSGPFVTAGAVGNIFLHSQPGLARPDVQIVDLPVHQHGHLWFPALTKRPTYALTARVGVLHTKSRGWVRLRSTDPLAHPRIRFNMFTDDGDLDTMVRAMKLSRELHRQSPLSGPHRGRSCCPARTSAAMQSSLLRSAIRPSIVITHWERAGWASMRRRWWMRSYECAGSRISASRMRPSCRTTPLATPMCRRS